MQPVIQNQTMCDRETLWLHRMMRPVMETTHFRIIKIRDVTTSHFLFFIFYFSDQKFKKKKFFDSKLRHNFFFVQKLHFHFIFEKKFRLKQKNLLQNFKKTEKNFKNLKIGNKNHLEKIPKKNHMTKCFH